MATLLQISANTGPDECCLAVVKLLEHLEAQARARGLGATLVEEVPAVGGGLLQSALLALEGDESACRLFAAEYMGTVQWTCTSPFRPRHKRKNWYLDVTLFSEPAREFDAEVRFETMRASGPGGQHVNKTETAVRATHIGSGLSVKVGSSRSQKANKAAALALLHAKLREQIDMSSQQGRSERRLRHCAKPGGQVVKRFVGLQFAEG